MRSGSFVAVRACYAGEDLEERGEELPRPWRSFGEWSVVDTFGVMPAAALDAISMDPADPVWAYGHAEILRDLSPRR